MSHARTLPHALALGILSASTLSAAPLANGMKLGIDFGPTLTANWNNITTNNQSIAAGAVVNLGGTVVDGVAIATANGQFVNNDGTNNWLGLATNGGSLPPDFVDSVITDIAGNFSLVPDDTPYRITITGLNPALALRFDLVATATGTPTDTFTITGAASYGPSAIARPTAQSQGLFHTFTNVYPDAQGTLVINVTDSGAGKNPIVNGILITVGQTAVSDSDSDGLPDSWEQAVFGNLAQTAAGDFDQDGDTNLTEFEAGTNAALLTSNSGAEQAWQIDFQGGPGGGLGSANPVTSTADFGYGSKWNAFEIPATNNDVFANPPTNHNAVIDPVLGTLRDAADHATDARLEITGGVSAFNVGRILDRGGVDHSFGDHWFWGAQGRTTATLGFTYRNLPPGTYSLTAYANPDQHNPPRDFGLVVGATTVPIQPAFGASFYANAGTFAGTVREITVDGSGTLSGSLTTIGGDPSIAAMVLRRTASPTNAIAVPDTVKMNHGGKWRAAVLANDVVISPLASVEIVQAPAAGTATVNADGSILYQHLTGTPASDSLSYRIHDASGTSQAATVSINFTTGIVPATSLKLPAAAPVTDYVLEDAFAGRGAFNFGTPTWMATIPGNSQRFFVSERTGIIWEIPNIAATPATRRVFMDFTGRLDLFTEMGVKSFAFHPEFQSGKPYIFVTYNYEASPSSTVGTVRLSRFTATGVGLDNVDLASEQILFEVDSRSQDHNLDSCRFGPDGYLYVGSGDERRPAENAQTITNMFWSSVIRIDVDRKAGNLEPNASGNPSLAIPVTGGLAHYKIPADNPYAASSGTVSYNGSAKAWDAVRSEIYISGVRNPWQFTFDTIGGEPVLWLGDIGSDGSASREEVNIFRKGDNGGWDHIEGDRANRATPAGTVIRSPEWFYQRGSGTYEGASVTGGFVVNSPQYPDLQGKYIFGDWLSGHVWTLQRGTSPGQPSVQRIGGLSGVVGFTTDPSNGDILALSWNSEAGALFDGSGQVGKVFRLKSSIASGSPFPATLTATGAFADLASLTPNPGLHFYEPNLTFWSDHARKQRWFALPQGGQFDYAAEGPLESPPGSVWVKHFDLETERGSPATKRRLETRFIVKEQDGGVYGVSYKWNEAGTEATLVGDGGDSFDIAVTDPSLPVGQQQLTQHWQIPSRAQCITCHNSNAGQVLGFDSRQLNREDIPFHGASGNYLQLLANAGYLSGLPADPASLPRHRRPDDEGASLEQRVRSYLAVNCAYCHADAQGLDLRASTPLDATHLLHMADGGQITVTDPLLRRIRPGAPDHSSVLQRIAGTAGFNRMPPLASNAVDQDGVELLRAWILGEANGAPVFANAAPIFVIQPASPAGTVVGSILASDPDAPRDQVRYSITGSSNLFAIDPESGIITVKGDLSGAGATVLSFELVATDDFTANPRSASVTVKVNTSGINSPPRFHSPAHYYLPATLPQGSRVGTVIARDPEGGSVSYQVIGGTTPFTVDPASGEIRVAGNLTAGVNHTLQVRASDGNGTPATAVLSVTFHVVAQESSLLAPESGRVFWNIDFQGDGSSTAAGQTTTPITATAGGMFWNAFAVKAYSGNPSAMSTDPAMDLATHAGGTATPVRFHIFTDNDPATEIGAGVYGYSGRAGTNSLTGDYLLLLNQAGANGPLYHQWEITGLTPGWQYDLLMQGGYDGSTGRGTAFTIDLDGDGDLADESPTYLTTAADTVANSCVVRSVIADAQGRILGRSAREAPAGQAYGESNWAAMQIRASRSSPPAFTTAGPFSVSENSPAGTVVGTVSAIDPEGLSIAYAIQGEDGMFAIHPTTGQLTLVSSPDYERAAIHVLMVTATDAAGAISEATMEVNVLNLSDTNLEKVSSWLNSHSVPGGFGGDPDHDGIVNAFEMLFGGDPLTPGRMPVFLGGVFYLDAEVDSAAAAMLAFHAEHSLDCQEWEPTGLAPETISEQAGKTLLRFAAPPVAGSVDRRFMRLAMDE